MHHSQLPLMLTNGRMIDKNFYRTGTIQHTSTAITMLPQAMEDTRRVPSGTLAISKIIFGLIKKNLRLAKVLLL